MIFPKVSGKESAIIGGKPWNVSCWYSVNTCTGLVRLKINGKSIEYLPDSKNSGLY
ncbi:hypothetical protein JCM19301_3524 [Jejuia pallidilutea]|uniref:Uncharacterized protein n=1 Tax=Jejuia pallidilutea TaxID=504487 RepID=A0A090VR98_9FLAO|nr:hypothetical protein JCM19301_3524 [Jejuia pallidilutea]